MFRVDCVVYERFRDGLLSRLHSSGLAQVDFVDEDFLAENSLFRPASYGIEQLSELLSKSKELIELLSRYSEQQVGFLDSTLGVDRTPKTSVKEMGLQELFDSSAAFLNPRLQEFKSCEERTAFLRSRQKDITSKLSVYRPLVNLKHPLDFFGLSERLYVVVGFLPTENMPQLEESLRTELGGLYFTSKFDEKDGLAFITAASLASLSQSLDKALALNRFTPMDVEREGFVAERIRELSAQLEAVDKEISEKEAQMSDFAFRNYSQALVTQELLEIGKQKQDVCVNLASTGRTLLIRMWVPAKKFNELEELINFECEGLCIIDVQKNPADAPVLFDNPKIFQPFEMLTRMFSMPTYNQVDPTALLAPTFVLFFGFMFADVVYGILLIGIAYLLHRKYGEFSRSLSDFSLMLCWFGVSSMIFGVITGSYLGDFLGAYLLGNESGSQSVALWLDPMFNGNIMVYIGLAIVVGLVHTTLGYAFGGLDAVRRRDYKNAFLNYFTMVLLPIGLVSYALWNSTLGLIVSIVCLILVLFSSGVISFYLKVSGLLGNSVSYARLLALMAASSGISMTINFLTALSLSIPYAGFLIAPLIFIGGHVINLGLNVLGSFVHTLRLHYVEFFGTFYEGGGVEFVPFMEARKYSIVQKEVK